MVSMAIIFSEQLRAAIRDCGRSRYALSKETEISQSNLSRFVRGESRLSPGSIDKLVAALGLELRPVRRGKDHV
jgi:hypothetical protein